MYYDWSIGLPHSYIQITETILNKKKTKKKQEALKRINKNCIFLEIKIKLKIPRREISRNGMEHVTQVNMKAIREKRIDIRHWKCIISEQNPVETGENRIQIW